jgi:crotonobetainyl-CoA:carnitine CoA-transferase CaiB-like acyl-CoA transferase
MVDKTPADTNSGSATPLAGIRVLELSHMIMGPCCGQVLGDLGADVIKIEPIPTGDKSRQLTGHGVGIFAAFNRNKRSICVDLRKPSGLALVHQLAATADVLVENFRPGAMEKLGLGFDALSALNSRLIYCACKGFLPGPYEHRPAVDELVQMMGGLAYMTGLPGRPLRAGASVNDVMGGVFGALAILAALLERDRTGKGSLVRSGLFETNMVFVAQHMAAAAILGRNPPPFGDPEGTRPWPIYDVFDTADPGEQIFVGVVTDSQWRDFCRAFDLDDLLQDPALASKEARAQARPAILSRVRPLFHGARKAALMEKLERLGLPFAPLARPADLFDDPHLIASGGLVPTDLTVAQHAPARPTANLPGLPLTLSGSRTSLRRQPPRAGEHSIEIAREAGLSDEEIRALMLEGALAEAASAS